MKNQDYIRKYFLYVSLEPPKRPIDDSITFRNFLRDIYFDYKSLLDYESLKGELSLKNYDNIFTQIKQKIDSLSKKTPYGIPDEAYKKIDEFYYQLMEEFCPFFYKKIEEIKSWSYDPNYYDYSKFDDFFATYKFEYYGYRKNDLDKFPKIVSIAYNIWKYKKEDYEYNLHQENIRKQKIHKERMENDPQYRERYNRDNFRSNFYGFFFGNFFDDFSRAFFNDLLKDINVPTESFAVMDLEKNCTEDEVKTKYRSLVMVHHPDKGGSKEKFVEITEAKDKILNYIKSK